MFKRTVSAALIFGAAAIAPPAVHAQQANCAPRDQLIERLQSRFSEHLSGGGLRSANELIEIWTSDQTGSFTVIISRADGISCIVASGKNWNSVVPAMVPSGVRS